MRYLLIAFLVAVIFLTSQLSTPSKAPVIDKEAYEKAIQKIRFTSINCSPDWTTYHLSKTEIQQMIPLPGTGSHTWKISTKSDSAQFYFNQGINLYYGFHIIEALPSFKKAQLFDSSCSMLYWAEALAYGPNINDFGYAASPDALTANKKAKQFIAAASVKEKALIEAMQLRYSNDTLQKREVLNQQYADKMKALYGRYSTDAEIGTLYADAMMIQHPWDLWGHNWQPKPWTPQIRSVLENVLKNNPNHPGANHYYIHVMEASPFAYKANASADRLGRLAPGIAHIVHMPSHIYIRTGQYEKGIGVNKEAVNRHKIYLQLYPDVANNPFLYEIHNRHMQAASAINTNNYKEAIEDAIECRNSFDTSLMNMDAPMGDLVQYVYMTPVFTMLTFDKWNEILNQPDVPQRWHYAALLQHFLKGMAYANTGKLLRAKQSLKEIETLVGEKDIHVVMSPFNAPITGGTVSKYLLMGTIEEKENNLSKAIDLYKKAVATEDSLIYDEPRDWLIPARHYLGNALLKAKKVKEAEKVFRDDLKVQPKNYISTKGLAEAMKHK